MPAFKNWDPGRFVVVVNGVQIQGYADGTFIKASRNVPSFSTKTGADGLVVRTKSRNRTGKLVITLMQSSPSNDYLAGLVAVDEATDGASPSVGPSLVKDLNGTTFGTMGNSWVMQPADLERGSDSGNVEWTIEGDALALFTGGALV